MIKLPHPTRFTGMGFVTATFLVTVGLTLGSAALPLAAQSPSLPATGVVITEDGRLNLRDQPATGGAIVGKIEPQTELQVLSVSDDSAWYQVSADGIGTGWVSAQWVSLGANSAAGSPPRSGLAALVSPPTATAQATARATTAAATVTQAASPTAAATVAAACAMMAG